MGKNDAGIYMKERENLGLAIKDLYLPVSQKQDNKSLKTAEKNTRIKWMAKFVIYKSVFLPGWFESKWFGKRLSVIINSECKKNGFDVFYG